jgi:hypothetical protein
MSPSSFILSDKDFWEWMQPTGTDGVSHPSSLLKNSSHHEYYLKILAKLMAPPDYIAHFGEIRGRSNNAKTIAMLIERVPRWYFLELQYCMATYARIFGTLFPVMLGDIGELSYIEWLLYVEPEHAEYRDHLVHMFKVAYTGAKLLSIPKILEKVTEEQFCSGHFVDWCGKKDIKIADWDLEYRKKIMEAALFLASIFHDIGYGHYYLNKYRSRLARVCRWILPEADPSNKEHRDTQSLLRSLPSSFLEALHPLCRSGNKNRDVIISGFYRDCLSLSHSVASALFIIDLAEQLFSRGALKPELYLAFQIAAEAVVFHDMKKEGTWLHLQATDNGHFLCCERHKDAPLAPIVSLADELAGWGRARLNHKLEGNSEVDITMKRDNSDVKIQFVQENGPTIKIRSADPNLISSIKDLKCLYSETGVGSKMKILSFELQPILSAQARRPKVPKIH